MASILTPFNVRILQLSEKSLNNMRQITTLDTFDGATKNFNTNGLFSNEIFGANGDKLRMRRFAYIDIKLPILHPLIFRTLGRLKRIYPEIMAGKTYAIWDPVEMDFVKSDPVEGETGFAFFMEYFMKINFPQRLSDLRELNIKFIERMRPMAATSRIIVAPAGFRDYVIMADGREEEDEVNKLYRKLIASSNSVSLEMYHMSPKTYDRVRQAMQMAFNSIYEYYETIIKGKNKLLQGRVMTRQVRDGTRSVITTQNLEVKELFGEGTPTTNSLGIGLFQFMKAFRPVCLYEIQNGFLRTIFRSPGAPVKLVNMKTLHAEEVQLPLEDYDLWMTREGNERLLNLFNEIERRHAPVVIEEYYLGLIYNDGKGFRLFSDIDELPVGVDRKHVRPISFAEFMYSQVYTVEGRVTMNATRFPVTGFGSIFPTEPFLKVTMRTERLAPLGDDWQPIEGAPVAPQFPIRGEEFVDTLMPAPDKLKGATADFDGDKMSGNGTYTIEAVAESKAVMRSRAFHVKPDNTIAHSLATDTVEFLFGAMTGAPIIPQQTALQPAKEFISLSSLREAADSVVNPPPDTKVIRLNGKHYDPAALYEMQEERGLDVRVPLASLGYARDDMRVTDDVMAAADANGYVLVTGPVEVSGEQRYNLLYGADILLKAKAEGADSVNAYLVDQEALDKAELVAISKEAYEEDGSFHSRGNDYDLNKIFKEIEESNLQPVNLALSEVDWVLEYDIPRQDRVDNADLSAPIVAMPFYNKHLAVDGLHRIKRAKDAGRTTISAYIISRETFRRSKIRNTAAAA